jgi:hypothetical protein
MLSTGLHFASESTPRKSMRRSFGQTDLPLPSAPDANRPLAAWPLKNIQGCLKQFSYKKQGIPAFFGFRLKGVFKALQCGCNWR